MSTLAVQLTFELNPVVTMTIKQFTCIRLGRLLHLFHLQSFVLTMIIKQFTCIRLGRLLHLFHLQSFVLTMIIKQFTCIRLGQLLHLFHLHSLGTIVAFVSLAFAWDDCRICFICTVIHRRFLDLQHDRVGENGLC